MFLITNIDRPHKDIPKHEIGQKIHMKTWTFQCEMEKKLIKLTKITTFKTFLNQFFWHWESFNASYF
jgi:hypothetical protein